MDVSWMNISPDCICRIKQRDEDSIAGGKEKGGVKKSIPELDGNLILRVALSYGNVYTSTVLPSLSNMLFHHRCHMGDRLTLLK